MNNNPYGYNSDPQNPMDNSRQIHYNTNYNTNYNRSSGKGCLIALAVFLLLSFGFFFFVGLIGALFSTDTPSEPTEPYVEILRVEGVIQTGNYNSYGIAVGYQHNWTIDELARLENDSLNKGIILYINSPGGGVYESYELYTALERYKENTGRPVVAYMAQYAASGGLMAAMAGDEIYANQMTTTGSIGVIISYYDMSQLMEKLGIEEVNITSGPNKAMGSGALNEEQRQIYQAIVDEYYDSFVNIVAKSRGLDKAAVRQMADGRIYTSSQALELGLIDAIADYSDFTDEMHNRIEFSDCEFVESYYQDNSLLGTFLSKLGLSNQSAPQAEGELEKFFSLLEEQENTPVRFAAE